MQYPVTLARDDNETILVSFPDFPVPPRLFVWP